MYLAITYLNHKQDLKLKYLLGIVTTDPIYWQRNGKSGSYYYYYYYYSEFGGHFRTLRGGGGPHKPSQLIANGLGFLSM